MNQQDDPYETLNVPRSATQAQIKSAYRKLALKFHPDKQTNDEDKKRCSEQFTKIGNAYEILGDPERRSEYDRFGFVNGGDGGGSSSSGFGAGAQHHDPFFGGFGGNPFMNDPFFARHHGRRGFMDPFDLFRGVFEDDLNNGFGGFDDGFGHQQQQRGGGFGSDPFGGMMGRHMDMMNSMMNMQAGLQNHQQQNGGRNTFSSYSSSSSSFGGGNGGVRESVSTSTRIINGKRQTITERTIVKPDGTVERTTETSGDDDFPAALGDNGHSSGDAQGNGGRYLPDSFGSGRRGGW